MQQEEFQNHEQQIGPIQQQTIENAPEINQNTQNPQIAQQNPNRRMRDPEDEMIDEIDEIIETDPDESQHHPIVDGDADEEQYDIDNNNDYIKSQKDENLDGQDEDDQFNHNFMQFDGYDSRFFTNNNKDEITDEVGNEKLDTQQNKVRATSAQRRQIVNKPPLMNSNGALNQQKENENQESNENMNDSYMPTPSQSQKFAKFSVTRPLSSAKSRPSDTQKKYGRGDRLQSAHHKNNQKVKVLHPQDQREKVTTFRRNLVIQPQNQMMPNKVMRTEAPNNKFYQTQQQFSSDGRDHSNYVQGMPTPNRNMNMGRGGPPMSAQSSNASMQPPYQYNQNAQYMQQQSPTQHNEKYNIYYPQLYDHQRYGGGQGYMQQQMQMQPFVYESNIQKYNSAGFAQNGVNPHLMGGYPQGQFNNQQLQSYYQIEMNQQRTRRPSQSSLLLQAQVNASETPLQQREETKVISVLDTNVENFMKFDIFPNHIQALCKMEQVKYMGTYNTFLKSLNEDGKQQQNDQMSMVMELTNKKNQMSMEKDKIAKKEAMALKKIRRQKRIRDKKQSQEEEDNDDHIIYRSNSRVHRDNQVDYGAYAVNADMNLYQQSPDNNMSFQDHQFYSDQNQIQQQSSQGMEYHMVNQQQEIQEREKLRQKQKNMQLQEKQFRLSMSSMKNQISEVINEDLNESIKSNTARDNMDNSFQKPKNKPIMDTEKDTTAIMMEKGAQDIQEKLPLHIEDDNSKSDVKQKKVSQESNKQDVPQFQASEPVEVFNFEHEDDVLPEAETQLISNIFKTQKDQSIETKENNDDVKDQIKDLMIIKQQQTDMLLNQFQVPVDKKNNANNEAPISYEAFFKNPSGKSENNNIIEDDLLQNQNKSATIIEDQLTYDEVEEEEANNQISPDQAKNPFCQDNDMFNEEYQASVTLKGQKAQGDQTRLRHQRSNSSRIDKKRESNNSEQKQRKDESQYSQISQQIEGISHLLQNLNNYVVSSTPDPQNDAATTQDIKEARFSYKMNQMTKFQGLPELPEEPNEQAENENSSGDIKDNKTKVIDVIPQIDHKSNADAYTLKTTQQSSKHGVNTNNNTDSQEGIINIQVQNNKKSPIRQSSRKHAKNQIRIKKIKRQKAQLNQNTNLKKSLSLNNMKSPDRKSQDAQPTPFKCGSFRPPQIYNSHSPELTEKRSLSPNMNQKQLRSYLKSAHPSINMQNRHSTGNVTYKKISFKKMKTMHDKKKKSIESIEAMHQQYYMPQRLQNSMSSMGFSGSHVMSQTLRQQNRNNQMSQQQQFLNSQSMLSNNNYLSGVNAKALRANRATTATRQTGIDMNSGQFLSNNRVFSAQQLHNKYNIDHQSYINIQNQDRNQELLRHQMPMMQQPKFGGTVRAPLYNQENQSFKANISHPPTRNLQYYNKDQYSNQASGDMKMKGKYNTIQNEIDLQQQNQRRIVNNSASPYRGHHINNYIQQGPNQTTNQMMQIQQVSQNAALQNQPDLVRYDLPQQQLASPYNQKIRLAPKGKRPISNSKNSNFYQTQRIGSQEFNMEQRPPLGSNFIQPLNDTRTQRMHNFNSQQFHGTLHDPRISNQQILPHAIGGGILRPQSSAPHLGGQTQQSSSIPPTHHYLNQNRQSIRPFNQAQQVEMPKNDIRIQSAHGGPSSSQNILFNDYQTKQSIPPLPQNSKSRLGSGKTKRVNQDANGMTLNVKSTKQKRASSSSRPRIASANLRSTLRSSRASQRNLGVGKDSKNSKKSSQRDRLLSGQQNGKKPKKQSIPNNANNNDNQNNQNNNQQQQNMQQPVVIQQIFGLGYSNMPLQNTQNVPQ